MNQVYAVLLAGGKKRRASAYQMLSVPSDGNWQSVLCNHFRQILIRLNTQFFELVGLTYEVPATIP